MPGNRLLLTAPQIHLESEANMAIELLNGSLNVDIYFDKEDKEFNNNICISLKEYGPEDEKIFYAGETDIFITPDEARKLPRC